MSPALPWLPWLRPALDAALPLRAHALLLHGPGSVGQFELALALARGWLCEADGSTIPRPCGACTACHLTQAQLHPDFHILIPDALRQTLGWEAVDDADEGGKASKAKPSKEIRVEAVRAAIEWGQKSSSRGRAKLILIHPAPSMNAIAANALLKTLEEPPGNLRLLLTAHDPEALLATVRSRCQRIRLDLPPHAPSLAWLAEQGIEQPEILLAAAGGQAPEAVALHAEGIDSSAWRALPLAVRHGTVGNVAEWPLVRLIEALQKLCHDLMALRASADAQPRYFERALLEPLLEAGGPTPLQLADWSRDLVQAARHDEHPWHAGLRSEALVERGARLWQTPRSHPPGRHPPLDTLGAR